MLQLRNQRDYETLYVTKGLRDRETMYVTIKESKVPFQRITEATLTPHYFYN